MKIKNVNLEFYAMNYDWNNKNIKYINVMNVIKPEKIAKKIKYKGTKPNKWNCIKNYDELKEYLRSEFLYHFWCKSEYEVIISDLFSNQNGTKVDVYSQILPNLDIITKYVIDKMQIKFKE